MRIFTFFPLLTIPVGFYNFIVFLAYLMGGPEGERAAERAAAFANERLSVRMPTGGLWEITTGDILLAVALVLLFVELLKSTSNGRHAIVNHALSLLLFIVCLVEFLILPQFATSVFFLIMLMTLLDVLAGVVVAIIAVQRQEYGGDYAD